MLKVTRCEFVHNLPCEQVSNRLTDLEAENAKLRELVRDMWHEGMCECGSLGKCATCVYEYPTRMRELGIEVN